LHYTCIAVLLSKVGIVDAVASHRTSNPGRISTIVVDCLLQSNKVTLAFAHLHTLNVDVPIAVVASWPESVVLPDGRMIEERHGQVVFDQIFGRASEVEGIPIEE